MILHRYQLADSDSIADLNRLLQRGWYPVRELPHTDTGGGILVLLQKESDVSPFPGDELVAGVPVEFLQDVMLFEDFSDEELRQIVNKCDIRSVAPEEVIFGEGDEADALFVLLLGEVSVRLPELPVRGQSVAKILPGGVFGESTFFSDTPHTMSAQAGAEGATLLTLERVSWEELAQAQIPAALKLAGNSARILAGRLQETDQWVWQLLSQTQLAEISASWRRFRHRVTGSDSGAFFGL